MSEDVSEAAARLRARMEAGELPRARLTLGDALGDVDCRVALGRPEPPPGDPESLEFWGRQLARFGPQVMLRVGQALARHCAEQSGAEGEVGQALAGALAASERFLANAEGASISEACEAAARALAKSALVAEGQARAACLATLPLLRAILDVFSGGVPNRTLLDAHYLRILQYTEACALPLEQVQVAVRDEVLVWALAEQGSDAG